MPFMLNQMRFLCGLYSFVLIVCPFLRSLGVPLQYLLNAMHVLFVFVFRLKTKIQFKPFYEFAAAIERGRAKSISNRFVHVNERHSHMGTTRFMPN